jgi:hypothetical protein
MGLVRLNALVRVRVSLGDRVLLNDRVLVRVVVRSGSVRVLRVTATVGFGLELES